MTEAEFAQLDPIADELSSASHRWFESLEFQELKAALQKATSVLPKNYSVTIEIELQVFDMNRENAIALLRTGLESHEGNIPHVVTGDSSVHRYAVNGEICSVPHDYCPHCWGSWDFKFRHPTCQTCGYSLGKEVKVVLDRDLCPCCEKGEVTIRNPKCDHCDYTVNPTQAYWG